MHLFYKNAVHRLFTRCADILVFYAYVWKDDGFSPELALVSGVAGVSEVLNIAEYSQGSAIQSAQETRR